jgi:hypothetical protein
MATTFRKDDAQTCCGCNSKDPSIRLISLQLVSNNARSLVSERARLPAATQRSNRPTLRVLRGKLVFVPLLTCDIN